MLHKTLQQGAVLACHAEWQHAVYSQKLPILGFASLASAGSRTDMTPQTNVYAIVFPIQVLVMMHAWRGGSGGADVLVLGMH